METLTGEGEREEDELPPWLRRRREIGPLYEMVAEGEPHQVPVGMRSRCGWIEREAYVDGKHPKSFYPLDLMLQTAAERRETVEGVYSSGLLEWPDSLKEVKEDGRRRDRKPEELEALAEELASVLKWVYLEGAARRGLLEKTKEADAFIDDVGNILEAHFLRVGKERLPSRYYGLILKGPETHEGFVPFGKKVEASIEIFKKIGEGEAVGTFELRDGRTVEKKMLNIFSLAPNQGLLDLALEGCVLPELRRLRNRVEQDRRAVLEGNRGLQRLEERDDYFAAVLAYGLFRHWDMPLKYAMGVGETGRPFKTIDQLREENEELALEMPYITGDHAKMLIEARRWREWGRGEEEGRREHPRRAGAPMSLGCYPILITSLPELVATEMYVDEQMKRGIAAQVENRPFEVKGDKIKISVYDRCWRNQIEIPVETNKGKEYVTIQYQPISLSEIPWDDVEIINEDSDDPYLEVLFGPRSDAYEIPKKLEGFYAYKGIFNEVLNTSYFKRYQEYTTTDKLLGMSKQIDIALMMLAGAHNIKGETMKKLSNYLRTVMIGELAAALESKGITGETKSAEKQSQDASGGISGGKVKDDLLTAVRATIFMPIKEDGHLEDMYEELVGQIMKNRRAPLPGEWKYKGRRVFEDPELKELLPLYPLGIGRDLPPTP